MPPKRSRGVEVELDIPGLSATDRGAPMGGFILVVEGLEGTGKSRLATTAPGKIAYYSLNIGSDRVIDQAREAGKSIHLGAYEYEVPKFVTKKGADYWGPLGEKINTEVYQPFLESFRAAAAHDEVRTLVQDRCDEFWDLAQRSNFGKLQQNSSLAYGPLNDEFIGPLKRAKRNGKIVVLIHDVKQAYMRVLDQNGNEQSREIPGQYKRAGQRQIAGLADAIIRTHYVPAVKSVSKTQSADARFEFEIVLSKHAMEYTGERIEACDFADLMTILKPNADASLWVE